LGGGGAATNASASGGTFSGASGATTAGGTGGSAQSGAAGSSPLDAVNLNPLAAAFDEFRMDLPCDHYQDQACEPQNSGTPNRGYLCCYVDETIERKNRPRVDTELVFGGDAATLYDVTLRIRGVVENRDYVGQGTKVGDWLRVGGSLPQPGAIHVFGVTVRDPEETYFFNSWNDTTNTARIIALDYEVVLPMRGGTKVRVFEYDDIGKIWANAEQLTVAGIPPHPNAFDGQFMQFDVVSVTARAK